MTPEGVYDRVAEDFDANGPRLFGPAGSWLVDLVRPPPGARVLDVGCGTGAVTIPAARTVGPSGRVDGIDSAPQMLRRLRAEAAQLGLHNIRARTGDAHDPPGRPGAYDVVTAGFVLFLLGRPAAATARFAGLLGPGGRLAVSTFGPPDPRWRWLLRLHLSARTARGPAPAARGLSATEAAGLFTAAGLGRVAVHERTLRLTFSGPEEWYAWSWSHGERAMWEAMTPAQRVAAREFAYARLTDMIERTGAAELAVTVGCTIGERIAGPAPDPDGG